MNFNQLLITGAALLSVSACATEEPRDTRAQGTQAPAASQDQMQPGSAAATGAAATPGSTGTQSGADPMDKSSGGATGSSALKKRGPRSIQRS